MIKILSIGNSFSVDAQCYLHQISLCGEEEIYCANLYIGGCTLKTHYENLKSNAQAYEYYINGEATSTLISIADALKKDRWDYITLQQASGSSGIWDTYNPFLKEIADYVRARTDAKLVIHQTWAYEIDSSHSEFPLYDNNQNKMYEKLTNCYKKAAELIDAHMIIPSGELIQTLRNTKLFDYTKTGNSLCRDGFHLDVIYARYAVGALWYKKLTGKSLLNNNFLPNLNNDLLPFDFHKDKGSMEKINLIKQVLEEF